jgi:hypothetical protein
MVGRTKKERDAGFFAYLGFKTKLISHPSLATKSGLSEMCESGTLLESSNGTEAALTLRKQDSPSPVGSSAFSAEGPTLCYQAGPSHYAAKPLAKSTALRQKSEDQSKRVSQPSYSRSNARSLEASDRGFNQAGQADDHRDRRPYFSVEERGRRLQAQRRRKAERIREEIPPAKILSQTFWARRRLFEKMTFWVTFWAKPRLHACRLPPARLPPVGLAQKVGCSFHPVTAGLEFLRRW